ncbi:MAG: single-stranded DNA-binding protein [Actinomycetota bacterium]|nr:single-stranded DNA-binding protein [Actinomycetota bacterium]
MAFNNTVTVVGNLTRDPELRFTNNGIAVARFGVAWNQRSQQGEDKSHFFVVVCWRDLAENVAESLTKGSHVIVHGRLDFGQWQTQDGDKRSKVEIMADDVALNLRFATAQANRVNRRDGEAGPANQPSSPNAGSDFGAGYEIPDEEPF